jgi:peptidoglycan/xylan/chitin deacetylase (PgdA/CDA1 family)
MIYVIAAVIALLGAYFAIPYWARNVLKRKFLKSIQKSGLVCLTFDDGPNPESTPELLDLLDELDVKATFFLVGQNIKKHPELLQQIIQHQHEVGDHGYRHVHAWRCFPFCAVMDLIRGKKVINSLCNREISFCLRPPYGKLNLITLCYVLLDHRRLAFWNVDPRDYMAQPPEQLCSSVLGHFCGGSVILLHERSIHTNKALEGNLKAIKMMVHEIKQRGYTFATVSQALGN